MGPTSKSGSSSKKGAGIQQSSLHQSSTPQNRRVRFGTPVELGQKRGRGMFVEFPVSALDFLNKVSMNFITAPSQVIRLDHTSHQGHL